MPRGSVISVKKMFELVLCPWDTDALAIAKFA